MSVYRQYYVPETVDQKIARWEKEVDALDTIIAHTQDKKKVAEAELHTARTEKQDIERNLGLKKQCTNLLKKHPYLVLSGDRGDIKSHEQFYISCDYPGIDVSDNEDSPHWIEADERFVWKEENGGHWDRILSTLERIVEIVEENANGNA